LVRQKFTSQFSSLWERCARISMRMKCSSRQVNLRQSIDGFFHGLFRQLKNHAGWEKTRFINT
jgi:hypothetical protein